MATRQLSIQTGVVKRLQKELGMYAKDSQDQVQIIQKMKDENQEPADIRQQERVLKETLAMTPDTHKRLEAAVAKITQLLEDPSIPQEAPERTSAQEALSLATEALAKTGEQ